MCAAELLLVLQARLQPSLDKYTDVIGKVMTSVYKMAVSGLRGYFFGCSVIVTVATLHGGS